MPLIDPIFLDTETRSETDITKTGLAVYEEDPSTKMLLLGYAVGYEEPKVIEAHPAHVPLPFEI